MPAESRPLRTRTPNLRRGSAMSNRLVSRVTKRSRVTSAWREEFRRVDRLRIGSIGSIDGEIASAKSNSKMTAAKLRPGGVWRSGERGGDLGRVDPCLQNLTQRQHVLRLKSPMGLPRWGLCCSLLAHELTVYWCCMQARRMAEWWCGVETPAPCTTCTHI